MSTAPCCNGIRKGASADLDLALACHRGAPSLGNIMRVRKEAYRQSSILRHQANHQVRKEPRNLVEVFGRLVR